MKSRNGEISSVVLYLGSLKRLPDKTTSEM
jgi:hypothetical protein